MRKFLYSILLVYVSSQVVCPENWNCTIIPEVGIFELNEYYPLCYRCPPDPFNSTYFEEYVNVTKIDFSNLDITSLPSGIFDNLPQLNQVILANNSLTTLNISLFSQQILYSLDLSGNPDLSLPDGFFSDHFASVDELHLNNAGLDVLPEDLINNLTALYFLELCGNNFDTWPAMFLEQNSMLNYLRIANSKLTTLPNDTFVGVVSDTLRGLDLSDSIYLDLPYDIFDDLTMLEELAMWNCSITVLPLLPDTIQIAAFYFNPITCDTEEGDNFTDIWTDQPDLNDLVFFVNPSLDERCGDPSPTETYSPTNTETDTSYAVEFDLGSTIIGIGLFGPFMLLLAGHVPHLLALGQAIISAGLWSYLVSYNDDPGTGIYASCGEGVRCFSVAFISKGLVLVMETFSISTAIVAVDSFGAAFRGGFVFQYCADGIISFLNVFANTSWSLNVTQLSWLNNGLHYGTTGIGAVFGYYANRAMVMREKLKTENVIFFNLQILSSVVIGAHIMTNTIMKYIPYDYDEVINPTIELVLYWVLVVIGYASQWMTTEINFIKKVACKSCFCTVILGYFSLLKFLLTPVCRIDLFYAHGLDNLLGKIETKLEEFHEKVVDIQDELDGVKDKVKDVVNDVKDKV